MKKKIYMNIAFLLMFLLVILALDAWSFTDIGDDLLGRVFFATGYRNVGSSSIVPAIEKTNNNSGYTKIVLGDSVCNQIFNQFAEENDDYLLLGTNQAVTVTGQYVLARNFIDNNENVSDIYMVLLPGGFSTDYMSEMSYSYLIEPFGKTGHLEYLSDETMRNIESFYGKIFTNRNVIRFIDGSCINNKLYLYYNQNKKRVNTDELIAAESKYYLIELKNKCDKENISLHILPSPIGENEGSLNLYNNLKTEIAEKGLGYIFNDYCERATFYPDEMFGDGVHFADGYNDKECCSKYIDNIIGKSSDFDGLVH